MPRATAYKSSKGKTMSAYKGRGSKSSGSPTMKSKAVRKPNPVLTPAQKKLPLALQKKIINAKKK